MIRAKSYTCINVVMVHQLHCPPNRTYFLSFSFMLVGFAGHTFSSRLIRCTQIHVMFLYLNTVYFSLHENFNLIKILLGYFQSFCLFLSSALSLAYSSLATLQERRFFCSPLPPFLSPVIPGSPLSSIGQAGSEARLAEAGILHGLPDWAWMERQKGPWLNWHMHHRVWLTAPLCQTLYPSNITNSSERRRLVRGDTEKAWETFGPLKGFLASFEPRGPG